MYVESAAQEESTPKKGASLSPPAIQRDAGHKLTPNRAVRSNPAEKHQSIQDQKLLNHGVATSAV
jgi:hypothetical protein